MRVTGRNSSLVRRASATGCALIASATALGGGAYLALSGDLFRLELWLLLQLVGAAASVATARCLGPLERVDTLAILMCAVFVPVFGPPLAWAFVALTPEDEHQNAHAHFEDEDADQESYERTGMTGEFDVDFARQTSAISYAQILRQGTLQKRRNLLRSLARIGSPHHVSIIRRCLCDDEPELRLCAHGELERLAREHEDWIAKQRKKLTPELDDGTPGLPGNVARSCREYALSGIFDAEMSEFWMMQAERHAAKARERAPDDPAWVRLHAEILVEVGQFEAATDVLDFAGSEEEDLAAALIRVEIAFADRDHGRVREIAEEFERQYVPVPDWIAAIAGHRSFTPTSSDKGSVPV